ncbi:MAG TPA: serine/threonine-protein kinase, partial [Nannocystaceae bacterium]|nr:serine/threonine-protein kinase [Nannocystaceae bacterium]
MGSSQPSADDEVTEAVDLGRPDREELQPGAIVGRYVVVARVGAGGMGVVYLARDPDLDRNVALKLLAPTHERGRALREAQALAKLSHPNVVAVFDVGVLGERVWLAMEFVEGTTLAQWLRARDRGWTEVLPVLLAAGDGLAAAHDVKLVHRDVKPDNIMVAKGDGDALRVLVTDFGLAREIVEDPAATPVRGTPAYMAPERHRAGSVDAKVDQFGWCVTAWEALYGERPFEGLHPGALLLAVTRREIRAPQRPDAAPRWLRRALERGLDPDPAQRWPSLGELLLHVRRTSTRRRRRVIAAIGLLAIATIVAIPVARQVQASRAHAECVADVAAIDRLWPGQTRAAIDAALRDTRLTFADDTAERVAIRVDDWVQEWRAVARAACDADEPALRDAVRACLAERRASLATLLDRFAKPDVAVVRGAVSWTAGLARATDCADGAALSRRPRPAPADVQRVAEVSAMIDRVRAEASGTSAADEAVATARAIGWPPLLADALTARARLADGEGDATAAVRMLEEAYAIATAANADDQAFAAALALMNVIGMSEARPADGMTWAMHAEALLARRVPPDRLAA